MCEFEVNDHKFIRDIILWHESKNKLFTKLENKETKINLKIIKN